MRALFYMISVILIGLSGCEPAPAAISDAAVPIPVVLSTTSPTAFTETLCWRELPTGLVARCGYVTVPENRAKPDGNTIRLAVMILRQVGREPSGAPTFLLAGGPGQDAIGLFADLFGYWDELRSKGYPRTDVEGQLRDWMEFRAAMDILVDDLDKREFVVFDQRGAGYSEPSLKCHGERYDRCHRRLVKNGIDLAAYNTAENAGDVEAIRVALSYDTINLQAGSYGTRLAYAVLRQNRDKIRAVVFDSALPPEVNWYVETIRGYAQKLDALFDHCSADPGCRAAYPELKSEFYALVERLDRAPLPLPDGGYFDGGDFMELTWRALYDIGTIRWLPALIHQTYAQDYRILETWGEIQASEPVGETMAWGMNYSIECGEEWSGGTRQAMLDSGRKLPLAIRAPALDQFAGIEDVCRVWSVPVIAARESLKSDAPALFLSGELDPATPPAWAAASARNFSHVYRYVFPGMGHTDNFFSRCWSSIQSQFLDDPMRPPDASCIGRMRDGEFVIEK